MTPREPIITIEEIVALHAAAAEEEAALLEEIAREEGETEEPEPEPAGNPPTP
jgi:hypothetical protein